MYRNRFLILFIDFVFYTVQRDLIGKIYLCCKNYFLLWLESSSFYIYLKTSTFVVLYRFFTIRALFGEPDTGSDDHHDRGRKEKKVNRLFSLFTTYSKCIFIPVLVLDVFSTVTSDLTMSFLS